MIFCSQNECHILNYFFGTKRKNKYLFALAAGEHFYLLQFAVRENLYESKFDRKNRAARRLFKR